MRQHTGLATTLIFAAVALSSCAAREPVDSDAGEALAGSGHDATPIEVTADVDAQRSWPQPELPQPDASVGDAASSAAAEICDGIDNDGDGTIDNVDLGHDGICDCLRIATVGAPGSAGVGDVFGAWLDQRSDDGALNLRDATLTPELLARFQVIVAQDLHDQRAYSAAELDALEAWIRAGGGLLTLTGYFAPSERSNVNAILQRFSLSYGADLVLRRGSAKSVPITSWMTHPVSAGIRRVGADSGYSVEGDGTALASEGGVVLAQVKELGAGHLIAWGDEWITYDSEWQNGSDYQVEQLWRNMIKWLTAAHECQVPVVLL